MADIEVRGSLMTRALGEPTRGNPNKKAGSARFQLDFGTTLTLGREKRVRIILDGRLFAKSDAPAHSLLNIINASPNGPTFLRQAFFEADLRPRLTLQAGMKTTDFCFESLNYAEHPYVTNGFNYQTCITGSTELALLHYLKKDKTQFLKTGLALNNEFQIPKHPFPSPHLGYYGKFDGKKTQGELYANIGVDPHSNTDGSPQVFADVSGFFRRGRHHGGANTSLGYNSGLKAIWQGVGIYWNIDLAEGKSWKLQLGQRATTLYDPKHYNGFKHTFSVRVYQGVNLEIKRIPLHVRVGLEHEIGNTPDENYTPAFGAMLVFSRQHLVKDAHASRAKPGPQAPIPSRSIVLNVLPPASSANSEAIPEGPPAPPTSAPSIAAVTIDTEPDRDAKP